MVTTVTSTIGTGGTYTTLQSWEDACPANLVTDDKIWRGEAKKQVFSAAGTTLTIAGQTTDATRYVELTAEAGASFVDDANVRTNPLKYDSTKGAALSTSSGYSKVLYITANYTRVSKLQFYGPSHHQRAWEHSASGMLFDTCIVLQHGNWQSYIGGANNTVRNCLFIGNGNTSGVWFVASAGNVAQNCTVVRYSDSGVGGGVAWATPYAQGTFKNCAFFGYSGGYGSGAQAASSNNATDGASFPTGSNNIVGLTYAGQFENTTSGAPDFRVKAGSGLIDAGVNLSGSGVTADISGTARGGAYDIGAWETGSSGISGTLTATLGAATLASTATVAIAGTSTATLAAATLFATGTLAISGTATATLAATTVVAAGTVAITGATSATLAAATLASTGTISISATLSSTLDAATLSASGTASSVNTGTLTATLAAATLSAASTLALRGTTNTTLANATLSSTGTLSLRASSSVTLAGVSLNATGVNGNIVRSVVLVWNGVRI